MMNFLRKHVRIIFIITITAFIISLVPVYLFCSKDYIAKVNGEKIPVKLFNSLCNIAVKAHKKITNNQITDKNLNEIQNRILNSLILNEIFYQQSKLYGITVTDKEVKAYLQNSESFKTNNAFDKQKYYSFLKLLQMTPKEYETLEKKQMCEFKLKTILLTSVKVWNYELQEALKENPSATKTSLYQTKINFILKEWHSNIFKNSKITINNKAIKKTQYYS